MGVQAIPTGGLGPLPPQTMGLVVGRSSTTIKGIKIAPGIIDKDYTGEIKVLTHSPGGVAVIEKGQRLAQLLFIPYIKTGQVKQNKPRGIHGFGSSDACWVQAMNHQRPERTLTVNGRSFIGLLDTGADVSLITAQQWPAHWPKHQTVAQLQGLGMSQSPEQRSDNLHWKDQEGHRGTFQPYIAAGLAVNLWGSDTMSKMGVHFYSPNQQVTNMMFGQGFLPENGLGTNNQGRRSPIVPSPLPLRSGLGYFQLGSLSVLYPMLLTPSLGKVMPQYG